MSRRKQLVERAANMLKGALLSCRGRPIALADLDASARLVLDAHELAERPELAGLVEDLGDLFAAAYTRGSDDARSALGAVSAPVAARARGKLRPTS